MQRTAPCRISVLDVRSMLNYILQDAHEPTTDDYLKKGLLAAAGVEVSVRAGYQQSARSVISTP